MKRYLLVTLTFLFLLSTGTASASSLLDTQQFRALDNYVLALEGRSDANASAEDKETYKEQLRLRRDVALERLENLKMERIVRAEAQYKQSKKRALGFLQKRAQQKRGQAQKNLQGQLSSAEKSYKKALAGLKQRYGKEIASLQKKITDLQKKMEKSKDLEEKVEIGNSINSLQGALRPLQNAFTKTDKKARATRERSESLAQKNYRKRLLIISSEFKRDWSRAQKQALSAFARNKQSIAATVRAEKGAVLSLFSQGLEIIAAMPSPEGSKKKSAKKK